jgi:hypothetical protein
MKINGFLNSRLPLNVYLDPFGKTEQVKELLNVEPERVLVSWGDHDAMPVQMPKGL